MDEICCNSLLPSISETINLFISSVKHLVLDIQIFLASLDLTYIDFSPLAILGAASLSIPHIDLYVYTNGLAPAQTHAQLLSSLDKYEDIMRLIKEDILVIHPERSVPECI